MGVIPRQPEDTTPGAPRPASVARSSTTPLAARLGRAGPKRVLALDAMGVPSLALVGLTGRLEALLRDRFENPRLVLADYFDLIVGVSTAAWPAVWFAAGGEAHALTGHMRALWPHVFKGRGKARQRLAFNAKPWRSEITKQFGSRRLDALDLRTGLAVVLAPIEEAAPASWLEIVTNAPAFKEPAGPMTLAEVILASQGHPGQKQPYADKTGRAYDDAGLSVAANPSVAALLAATAPGYGFGWQPGENALLVVSLGVTGMDVTSLGVAGRLARQGDAQASAVLQALSDPGLEGLREGKDQAHLAPRDWGGEETRAVNLGGGLGGLEGWILGGRAQLTYRRCALSLRADAIAALSGRALEAKQAAEIRRLDNAATDNLIRLETVGREVGARLIDHGDLPGVFNPRGWALDGEPLGRV